MEIRTGASRTCCYRSAPVHGRSKVERAAISANPNALVRADIAAAGDGRTPGHFTLARAFPHPPITRPAILVGQLSRNLPLVM
ncbi:hypothetical protein LBMAG56_20420 [Verrucomicrobiota bacterium]|nr:hypothetical protein LBMAG56_20420 [Verrucomicrobiota bacterium]